MDFLEDTAFNLLIFLALGRSLARRARVGMVVPALAFLWSLVQKYLAPVPPDATVPTLVGLGALAVNLTRAAFLSARNDALANVAIIGAGLLTAAHPLVWPDVIVGLAIAALNLDAARAEKLEAAA